jgi:DNA-binding NtrC family response regulator
MTVGQTIDVQDLPEYLRSHAPGTTHPAQPIELPDDPAFEAHEKRLLIEALERANGNQSEASRFLRIGRDALRYKMKKHGLDVSHPAKAAAVWLASAVGGMRVNALEEAERLFVPCD